MVSTFIRGHSAYVAHQGDAFSFSLMNSVVLYQNGSVGKGKSKVDCLTGYRISYYQDLGSGSIFEKGYSLYRAYYHSDPLTFEI